jgi:hypothetical protein
LLLCRDILERHRHNNENNVSSTDGVTSRSGGGGGIFINPHVKVAYEKKFFELQHDSPLFSSGAFFTLSHWARSGWSTLLAPLRIFLSSPSSTKDVQGAESSARSGRNEKEGEEDYRRPVDDKRSSDRRSVFLECLLLEDTYTPTLLSALASSQGLLLILAIAGGVGALVLRFRGSARVQLFMLKMRTIRSLTPRKMTTTAKGE